MVFSIISRNARNPRSKIGKKLVVKVTSTWPQIWHHGRYWTLPDKC